MLTKSRWWLTKSSGGARVLGDRTVEDYVDTCRENGGGVADMRFSRRFGGLGLKTTGWTVSGFVKKYTFIICSLSANDF